MPVSFAAIRKGGQYSRKHLARIWGYRSYQALARGVVTPRDDNKIMLFVTQEKQNSAEPYDDRLREGILEWEGPTDHFGEDRIINASDTGDEVHLFYRAVHHSDFVYHGRIRYVTHIPIAGGPTRFTFQVQGNAT